MRSFLDVNSCTYVIGLDAEVVREALEIRYGNDTPAQEEYLGKIVQLDFELPELGSSTILELVEELMPKGFGIDSAKLIAKHMEHNPRAVKRMLNSLIFTWHLSRVREDISDVVTLARLTKIIILKHRWPELYELFAVHPKWLALAEEWLEEVSLALVRMRAQNLLGALKEAAEDNLVVLDELPEELIEVLSESSCRLIAENLGKAPIQDEVRFSGLQDNSIEVMFRLARQSVPAQVFLSSDSEYFDRGVEEEYKIVREVGKTDPEVLRIARRKSEREKLVLIKELNVSGELATVHNKATQRIARGTMGLRHPSLVRVLDVGYDPYRYKYYWVLESMELANVGGKLVRSRMDVEDALRLAKALFSGLEYLHRRGIVLGSIRPALLMGNKMGNPRLAPLPELGVMRSLGNENRLPEHWQPYLAPEVVQGGDATEAWDVYSVGVILYECLAFEEKYMASIFGLEAADKLSDLRDDVYEPLSDVIDWFRYKDPERRCKSAERALEQLAELDYLIE